MVDIREENRQFRAMKLRTGIVRYITKNGRGYRYVNSIRDNFCWATDQEFYSAVESLLADGVVIQSR